MELAAAGGCGFFLRDKFLIFLTNLLKTKDQQQKTARQKCTYLTTIHCFEPVLSADKQRFSPCVYFAFSQTSKKTSLR
jgi:hypothetical protein